MRRSDKYSLVVVAVTAVQLAVGTWFTVITNGQSQDVINSQVVSGITSTEHRLDNLEALNLPVRIAVLEKLATDATETRDEIKKLTYGIIVTLFGVLVTQFIQIKGQRRDRNEYLSRGRHGNSIR